jgi:hypothetical protein
VSDRHEPDPPPPAWYVLPKEEGGWRVHDGGKPAPTAEFARKADAVAFARRQAACRCADGRRRDVFIFNRPRKLSPEDRERLRGYDYRTPRPAPPGGRGFGSLRGKIWMSDDFDELPPEIDEYFNGDKRVF